MLRALLLLILCLPVAHSMELVQKYAPILYFEKEEMVYPVNVEYFIQNSNLNQSTENGSILIDDTPTPYELSLYNDPDANYYLDNRIGTINDTRIVDAYRREMEKLGYTIYARVLTMENLTIIQYWMFYVFNKGTLNVHEGDWEMVQLILNSSHEPIEAMYSQHIGGQRAKWSQLKKDGTHMHVYVARGSHANYIRPYQGKIGLASDVVGKNGKKLTPNDYTIVNLTNQSWLYFAGRWGEFGSAEDELMGKRGPYGPAYRGEMWDNPISWGESLPSVKMLFLDWFFYNFTIIYIGISMLLLLFILIGVYRRYREQHKFSHPLVRKRISSVVAIIAIAIAIISLFLPWYSLSVDIKTGEYSTPGMIEILKIDGMKGIQINMPESNEGLIQIGALPIPFSVIIGIGISFFILGTFCMGNDREFARKIWSKYVWRGIKFLIPIVLIVIFIYLVTLFISLSAVEIHEDMSKIAGKITSSPMLGDEIVELPEYGTVHLKWGIQSGAILLLVAGIVMLLAGLFEFFR